MTGYKIGARVLHLQDFGEISRWVGGYAAPFHFLMSTPVKLANQGAGSKAMCVRRDKLCEAVAEWKYR
jgi:hypothetical protein